MPGDHFPGDQGEFIKAGGELTVGRWGLQPSWAKDRNFGKRNAYNARAETVAEKPTFRNAFRHRRCLVPAAAFYERSEGHWFRMSPREDEAFLIAGLWEPGDEEPTYTMVTTEPNHAIADVQDRMPVLLDGGQAEAWLSPEAPFEELRSLMVPCPPSWVTVEDAGPIQRRPSKAETSLFDLDTP
ncbi:SOS response-associated peptidase [bacterium]|nr:MAG: SOS response-associated peptidase [bacterium]